MFVTPVTVIPNHGAEKDQLDRQQLDIPRVIPPTSVTVGMQLLPPPATAAADMQVLPTQSPSPQANTSGGAEQFCLYFIFEDMNQNTKCKFMKYALVINSFSCTVSQQKSAWAYLLYHIISKQNTTDHPYSAMANCMKSVYFNKFRSALQADPIFPLLKSLTVLNADTLIKGFDIPDAKHVMYSIIEHFKINTMYRSVPALGRHAKSKTETAAALLKKATGKVPPRQGSQTVKQCLDAMRLSTSNPAPTQDLAVTPTNPNPVVANGPVLADAVNTIPVNIVRFKQPDSDAPPLSSVSSNHEENVINLDDYDNSRGVLRFQELDKFMFSSMSIAVPVIPIQGIVPLQNYQEIASSDSPILQLGTKNCLIDHQNNSHQKQDLAKPETSDISLLNTAVSKPEATTQNIPPPMLKRKSPIKPDSSDISVRESSGHGQNPHVSRVPSDKPPLASKQATTMEEGLGPTLKVNQLANLTEKNTLTQGKYMVVQGTTEVIIVDDSANETEPSKESQNPNSKSADQEVQTSKSAKKKSPSFLPRLQHLSLFDSSILQNSSVQKTPTNTVNTTTEQKIQTVNPPNGMVSSVDPTETKSKGTISTLIASTKQQRAKPAKRSAKIKDMIDLTLETPPTDQNSEDAGKNEAGEIQVPVISCPGYKTAQRVLDLGQSETISDKETSGPKETSEIKSNRTLKRPATNERCGTPAEKVMKTEEKKSAVNSNSATRDLSKGVTKPQSLRSIDPRRTVVVNKGAKCDESAKSTKQIVQVHSPNSKPKTVTVVLSPKAVSSEPHSSASTTSRAKHVPCILVGNKSNVKTESEEGTKRMTASNRWKFSKQRVHVSKREVVVESQHDLRIQPEPTQRRKTVRRKVKKEETNVVVIKHEKTEEEEKEVKDTPKELDTKLKSTKTKPSDMKAKPLPANGFREQKVGNKVYTWVPLKRRVGIMNRSLVDKDGNKMYKSKAKTSKFFSISKKRMMDLGLKGNEGRPLSPSSELENRKKALCKTIKLDDLVDKTCEQASFLSMFSLISTSRLESACSELTEGRTSRKRQIKAPSRYDL